MRPALDLPALRPLIAEHRQSEWAVDGRFVYGNGTKYGFGSFEEPEQAVLAVAAVNALPELSTEVEVARAAIEAARTALASNGHCGEGNLAEMIARALAEARQAGRDEMHEVDRALMDADRAFDGAMTRDWTGTIAERVRPLVAVYEAASAHVDKFRHTHDPLQGAAQLFDAVDATRKAGP